jgi:cytidylate kinase
VPEVRTIVTKWLRDMRSVGDIVVEGRDIGSVVYPDSPYRFYLDADAETRTLRRHKEDIQKGFIQNEEQVKASLLNRDKIDSSRKTAPLKIPEGAIVIDTSPLTAVQVAEKIIELSK